MGDRSDVGECTNKKGSLGVERSRLNAADGRALVWGRSKDATAPESEISAANSHV